MYLVLPVGLSILTFAYKHSIVEAVGIGVLFPLLGATIGVPMGLPFPFAAATKLTLIAGLLMAVLLVIVGWSKRAHPWGQVLAALGLTTWTLCGLLGLGTGT